MDVRFSPEQQALRGSVAHVVDRLAPRAVGALDDVERNATLDEAVAASGWRELRTAVHGGAPLASGVEAAIVAEELGRGLADVPFLGPTLAAELRRLAGVAPSARPETVAFDTGLSSTACVVGDQPPTAVAIDAQRARCALALVPSPGGHLLAEVALRPAEVRLDLTRPTAVPDPSAPVVRIAEPDGGLSDDDLTAWVALGLALTCADLVGVMGGAVRLACEYATNRRQYDVPIGSYQAVQHLLADAFVAVEGSRSVALHAAWAVDALPAPDALAAAAVAKAYCARAARRVCEVAIQVHGGIGNTWECLAHVYLRRALLSSDVLGGTATNLERVLAYHGIGGHHGLR
jgi:alkylation response protein AidB-like acyl-CoA dehydrogenase